MDNQLTRMLMGLDDLCCFFFPEGSMMLFSVSRDSWLCVFASSVIIFLYKNSDSLWLLYFVSSLSKVAAL